MNPPIASQRATTTEKKARSVVGRAMRWIFWIGVVTWLITQFPKEVSYWYLAAALQAAEAKDIEQALKLVDRAAAWTPSESRPHATRAKILSQSGQPEAALAIINDLLECDNSESLRMDRLGLLLRLGREKEYLEDVAKHGTPPNVTVESRVSHAGWLAIVGKYNEALLILEEAKPTKPGEEATLHVQRSAILKKMKRFPEALKEIELAQKLSPSEGLELMRISLLLHLKRFDDAAQACDRLEAGTSLLSKQTDAMFNNNLAYNRAVAGRNLEVAEVQAERAVILSGGSPTILDTRGYIYYLRQKHSEALRDLNRAVEAVETEIASFERRVQEGAEMFSELAVQRQRNENRETLAVILYHRSLIHDALKNPSEAEKDRARVRELGFEPNDQLF